MIDIVKRLENARGPDQQLAYDAADIIRQLRAQLREQAEQASGKAGGKPEREDHERTMKAWDEDPVSPFHPKGERPLCRAVEQKFTATQKRDEAKREIDMRRRVYGRIGMNRMREQQIAIMSEIAEDYARQAEAEAAGYSREQAAQAEIGRLRKALKEYAYGEQGLVARRAMEGK